MRMIGTGLSKRRLAIVSAILGLSSVVSGAVLIVAISLRSVRGIVLGLVALLVAATAGAVASYAMLQLVAVRESSTQARRVEARERQMLGALDKLQKAVSPLTSRLGEIVTAQEVGKEVDRRMLELVDVLRGLHVDHVRTIEQNTSELVDVLRDVQVDHVRTIEQNTSELVDVLRSHDEQMLTVQQEVAQLVDKTLDTATDLRLRLGSLEGAGHELADARSAELMSIMSSIEKAERRIADIESVVYQNVEAVIGLYAELNPKALFPPFRGWAMSPDLLAHIVRLIAENEPDLVVELGSGVSSLVIGLTLQKFGTGRLIAAEHDPVFLDRTRRMIIAHDVTDHVDLALAPLSAMELGSETWTWYDLTDVEFGSPIDLLVIDGPPAQIGRLARYPALPALHPLLASDAIVILDDSSRTDERETVARWGQEFPEFDITTIRHEKGTTELRRSH